MRRSGTSEGMSEPIGTADAGYIAGLFDGEGHVTITCQGGIPTRRSHALHVGFTNCDLAILVWLQQRIGGRIHPKAPHRGWRQSWTLRVNRRSDVATVLSLLEPHVKIKARQVEIGLGFLALKSVTGGRPAHNGVGMGVDHLQRRAELRATQAYLKRELGIANARGVSAEKER
jgi:hypothetical protein